MKRSLFFIIALIFLGLLLWLLAGVWQKPIPDQEQKNIPRIMAIRAEDPTTGPENAPITVVEFASFTCSSCRNSATTLDQLLLLYPHEVRLIWKDFPHDALAESAAVAARCAQLQGRFWQYQQRLYSYDADNPFVYDDFEKIAESLKLDMAAFNQCVSGRQTADLISRSLQEGGDFGISSVPYFIVNQDIIIDKDATLASWRNLIDSLLLTQ